MYTIIFDVATNVDRSGHRIMKLHRQWVLATSAYCHKLRETFSTQQPTFMNYIVINN